MKPSLILLFAALLAPLSAKNLVYQSPYSPMSAYSFEATGGELGDYLIGGVPVRGIGGNEIDGSEALAITFSFPVVMENLQLGRLFSGETAILTAGSDIYRLEAYGFNQGHYLKNGVLIADLFEDESTWTIGENAYGMWTLHDPFGSSVITSFTLSADAGNFGLMSFNTYDQALVPSAVPDGAPTIGLMAFGLFGLIALTKRLS